MVDGWMCDDAQPFDFGVLIAVLDPNSNLIVVGVVLFQMNIVMKLLKMHWTKRLRGQNAGKVPPAYRPIVSPAIV